MIKIQEKLPKSLKMRSTNTDKEVAQKVAKLLLEAGAVAIRTQIPFRLVSGILSPIYVDDRYLMSFPIKRKIIVDYLIAKIREVGIPDVVAGTATAGIPFAAWIADKLNLPMVYVRSKPKNHGKGNQIEGTFKRGQKVVVVEDMISTGQSSTAVIKALRRAGAIVTDEVAIYTHSLKEADRNLRNLKVKFWVLTDLPQVLDIAQKEGYLRPDDQIEKILEWAEDPQKWGKKIGFE